MNNETLNAQARELDKIIGDNVAGILEASRTLPRVRFSASRDVSQTASSALSLTQTRRMFASSNTTWIL